MLEVRDTGLDPRSRHGRLSSVPRSSRVRLVHARNSRHLVELFIEFVDEFYALKHIFLFQSNPVFGSEISQLVERVVNTYPDVTLTQIVEHPVIQALLGEHSLGMVVIDR